MKLHRLVLTNYRGISHREVCFPDHGVVVISGANEIGKSSMVEALDLLLESKDRSTKKEIKQVKPTHADVGSEVEAEITSGPYHFVYRKRFHKKCETQLTVLAPRREQWTGDEAHDRVRAILADTVDPDLWHAQRVLQTGSTCAVDLSGCDALSRALDLAAGDADVLSGTQPLLMDRIDAEYARYFTATGRPTGEWAAVIAQLADAEATVARCATALAEVDERVRRHAALTAELAELSGEQRIADARHTAAQAAADTVAALSAETRSAELIAAAAAATSAASAAAHEERLRLLTEMDARAEAIEALQVESLRAAALQETVREVAAAADTALEAAVMVLAAAQERVDSARCTVDQLADRAEADRLQSRLANIDTVQRQLDHVGAELSALAITDDLMQRIDRAAAAVENSRDQLALISAAVELTAVADIDLIAGERRIPLPAGHSWSITATTPTEIGIAGVLTLRVSPGVTTRDLQDKHSAAQQRLAAELSAAQVADVAAARCADQRRRELQNSHAQLTASLLGLCGGDQPERLRARLTALRADQPANSAPAVTDIAAARVELDAAQQNRAAAQADHQKCRLAATAAASEFTEKSTRAAVMLSKLAAQRAELDAAIQRLTQQRTSLSDSDLAAAAAAQQLAAHTAQRKLDELATQLAATVPASVAAELAAAAQAAEAIRARHNSIAGALREISVELAVFGTEGRKGQLDAAQISHEHAASQYARVGRRARAAELLRSVMARHRESARLRYVEPFRAELQRLGRPVFGPTFEVDIDSHLCIRSRTVQGRTVPYESLSGGAKEQLAILVRLAGAAMVAKEDSVPVLIDDALGFTDPVRLASMGEVFDLVGAHGQLIMLTCNPTRYDGVTGAHRIDLNE